MVQETIITPTAYYKGMNWGFCVGFLQGYWRGYLQNNLWTKKDRQTKGVY